MERIHNTSKKIKCIQNRTRCQFAGTNKPDGFWWADNSEWKDFVSVRRPGETMKEAGLSGRKVGAFDYLVELDQECRIVTLDDQDSILDFTTRYGMPPPWSFEGFHWQNGDKNIYDPLQERYLSKNICSVVCINWIAVSQHFDGIEILDYKTLKNNRTYFQWLDRDWEVSGGCVWNPKSTILTLLSQDYTPDEEVSSLRF
jgi:hypothetical protein